MVTQMNNQRRELVNAVADDLHFMTCTNQRVISACHLQPNRKRFSEDLNKNFLQGSHMHCLLRNSLETSLPVEIKYNLTCEPADTTEPFDQDSA